MRSRPLFLPPQLIPALDRVFIVMDFIEHDLKTLMSVMPNPFLQSEVKTLLLQLLRAVAHCHSQWILHRDLKTSNLLINNRGIVKVADFGLARRFGDPVGVGGMTQLVVTLWYRWATCGIFIFYPLILLPAGLQRFCSEPRFTRLRSTYGRSGVFLRNSFSINLYSKLATRLK